MNALTSGFLSAIGAFGGLITAILLLLLAANVIGYLAHREERKHRRMLMDLEEVARDIVLRYVQDWGQSATERIRAINAGATAANIQAVFQQDPDGSNAGWIGVEDDTDRAIAFRHEIDNIARGSFENEVDQVMFIITRFRNRRDLEQKGKLQ